MTYTKEKMWVVWWLSALSLFIIPLSWMTLVSYFCFWGLGGSITYHRYYSHNSFKFRHPAFKWVGTFLGVMAGQGSPLYWAALHKTHHKHADTDMDPHTPSHGLLRAFVTPEWVPYDLRTVATMRKQPMQSFIYKYYFLMLILGWLLGIAVGVPEVIHGTGLSILAALSVNYFGHKFGYSNNEANSEDKNNWIVAVLCFGEGWHNNHHSKPNNWSLQDKWWEFDLGGFIIKHILADKESLK